MDVFEQLEAAGHDITFVSGPAADVSTYYCDRCGALVLLQDAKVRLFHVAHANGTSRQDECYPGTPPDVRVHTPLAEKLARLRTL